MARKAKTIPSGPEVLTYRVCLDTTGLRRHWRNLEVLSTAKADQAIGAAMGSIGADFSHLWEADDGNAKYSYSEDSFERTEDPSEYGITDLGPVIRIWYDFGDDWHIRMELKKARPMAADETKQMFPRVTNGAKCGLIDDVGGPWRLRWLIECQESGDTDNEDFEDFAEWYGLEKDKDGKYDWDPNAFDSLEANMGAASGYASAHPF